MAFLTISILFAMMGFHVAETGADDAAISCAIMCLFNLVIGAFKTRDK